jgi:RNA polymerase sigma factor (sigma-70 family)
MCEDVNASAATDGYPTDRPLTDDEKVEAIKSVLRKLTYREREIIKLRYGLGDGYMYTLEEVGHIFKVTRERIRQVEKKAIAKLNKMMGPDFVSRVLG